MLALHAQDVSAPDVTGSLVVLALEGLSELGELTLVLVLDSGQAEGGGGLLVHDGTQAGLSLKWEIADMICSGDQEYKQRQYKRQQQQHSTAGEWELSSGILFP